MPRYNESIRLWNVSSSTSTVTLSGHRAAVTALAFKHDGTWLVSESKDTVLIIWYIVSESGLYRLKGPKYQITCLTFLTSKGTDAEKAVCISTEGYLFSFSKGTLIKLWDLVYYYCCELLMGHQSVNLWSLKGSKGHHLWWCRTSVEGLQIDWHIMDLSLEELGEQTNNKDEKDATTAASLQKAINPYRNIPNSVIVW